jgi:serine/threonine-protein kinase
VPNVKGKALPAARLTLTKANCTVGTISKAYSSSVKQSRVISQKPPPGTRLPNRSKVSLVISRGRKA